MLLCYEQRMHMYITVLRLFEIEIHLSTRVYIHLWINVVDSFIPGCKSTLPRHAYSCHSPHAMTAAQSCWHLKWYKFVPTRFCFMIARLSSHACYDSFLSFSVYCTPFIQRQRACCLREITENAHYMKIPCKNETNLPRDWLISLL